MANTSSVKIVSKEIDVLSRLSDFGLNKEDIITVCKNTLHGQSLFSGLQPKTAEGLLKYIFGVEGLREVFLEKPNRKYEIFSVNNIEGVFDQNDGRKIMFQMVDQACGIQDPHPKSKIGEAKKTLIEKSTGYLFQEFAEEEKRMIARQNALQSAESWYVMVSIDPNGTVCCELSRPKSVENNKFAGFYERIYVLKYGDYTSKIKYHDDNQESDTFEIKPTIKKR